MGGPAGVAAITIDFARIIRSLFLRGAIRLVIFILTPILFIASALFFFMWTYDDDFMADVKRPPLKEAYRAEVERLVREFAATPGAMTSSSCRALFDAQIAVRYGGEYTPHIQHAYRYRNFVHFSGAAGAKDKNRKNDHTEMVFEKKRGVYVVRKAEFGPLSYKDSLWAADLPEWGRLRQSSIRPRELACYRRFN